MWYRYFIRLKELLLTGWLFFNAKNSLANKMPTSTGEFSLKQWKEVHDFFESGDIPLDKIEPSKLRYDEVQKDSYEQTFSKEKEIVQGFLMYNEFATKHCIDDTMISKFGTKFENISKLFDHAAHNGCNYLNGYCFVMVVEVALPKDRQLGRYPSFHPKTWVLAYVNADGDKKYRFVVMSRNLTFDRSWDISFAMDSNKNVRQKKKTQPICDFLDYLVTNVHNTSNNAGKKRNLIRGLCADIKDVSFSLDSKIFGENFEVLPLGIGKNAYRMQEDILFCKEKGNANSTFNELVVMFPFLSESVIADFNLTDRALSDCKRTLITRRSELGKLKASDVDNFTIYALKDEIIDGEDEISDELADKKKQDIHAKIYLRRKYSDVDLYLGSMNASYSAINKNVEMMLWLGTKNMYLNGNKFLEDIFCGPAGDVKIHLKKLQ